MLKPHVLLRLEGAVVLAVALLAYTRGAFNSWIFAAAFLVPDLGLFGYAGNPRLGAAVYNALHTYAGHPCSGVLSLVALLSFGLPVALAWTAHIAFDRALRFGLRYSQFKESHLQRLARADREDKESQG